MSIMPAIILTTLVILSNLVLAAVGAIQGESILIAAQSVGQSLVNSYCTLLAVGAVTTLSEWHRIHAAPARKILYTLTFPLFMFTYIPISFAALFARVEWKPIEHRVTAADLYLH